MPAWRDSMEWSNPLQKPYAKHVRAHHIIRWNISTIKVWDSTLLMVESVTCSWREVRTSADLAREPHSSASGMADVKITKNRHQPTLQRNLGNMGDGRSQGRGDFAPPVLGAPAAGRGGIRPCKKSGSVARGRGRLGTRGQDAHLPAGPEACPDALRSVWVPVPVGTARREGVACRLSGRGKGPAWGRPRPP